MPNQHTITMSIGQATDRQLLVAILNRVNDQADIGDVARTLLSLSDHLASTRDALTERLTLMAEQIDRLNTAVDRELADDAAQNQLITELRAQLDTAKAAAEQAATGEATAVQTLQAALDAADAAAQRLEANDAPATPADPQPEQPADPQPVEPDTNQQ